MLVLAVALLVAQAISAVLLYRAQADRRHEMLDHAVAFRLMAGLRAPEMGAAGGPSEFNLHDTPTETVPAFVPLPGDKPLPGAVAPIQHILTDQDVPVDTLLVFRRVPSADPLVRERLARRNALYHLNPPPPPDHILLAALRMRAGGPWLVARVPVAPPDPQLLATLIGQTLLIYGVLIGAMALILRHISRPLSALTRRVEEFAQARAPVTVAMPITLSGPEDIRRLIAAHNAMERRILALLDEKDVMLGAIGHDLKTPLAALRVRIESVEDVEERGRMAATIEDITNSLDDMLSLARVGRPSDPLEATELSALVASVVEEYEDMDQPVTLADTSRMVVSLRATWMRRALRNLIGNALRYGRRAHVTLDREIAPRDGGAAPGKDGDGLYAWAVIRIDDEGPGIAECDIAAMMEPFTRGEPSRNTETGGAGLGLTLARAIAEQHGGTLVLANRPGGGVRRGRHDAACAGLSARLRLPIGPAALT